MQAAAYVLLGKLGGGEICRYINQDEPALRGHSVTVKAGDEQIREMRESAAKTFRPEMAKLLQVRSLVIAYSSAREARLLGLLHLMLVIEAMISLAVLQLDAFCLSVSASFLSMPISA